MLEKSGDVADRRSIIVRLVRLTRWDEHVLFTLAATLLGVNLALDRTGTALDLRLVAIVLANVLAVTFAFMINDIEDAPDDARDMRRRSHNVVATGELAPVVGWRAALIVAAASLVVFAAAGRRALGVGSLTLLLGWLYSWRSVRLKAVPVLDVVSHVLMLSSLLFFGGYVAYAKSARVTLPVMVGVALISAYGQLYNQLRDYESDRTAGLYNTAYVLGKRGTRWMMYAALVTAGISFLVTLADGLIPAWIALLVVLLSPLVLVFRMAEDMRGSPAMDASGGLQTGAMVLVTMVMVLWLFMHIVR